MSTMVTGSRIVMIGMPREIAREARMILTAAPLSAWTGVVVDESRVWAVASLAS